MPAQNSYVSSIQKTLNIIDWNKYFSNVNVEKQVNILNDTLFNIFSNFVRSKVITAIKVIKDPPWRNEEIKCKINPRTRHFNNILKMGEK